MTMAPNTPSQYTLSGWSLTDLLPDTAEATIDARLKALETAVQDFEQWRAKLGDQTRPGDILAIMQDYEALVEQMYTLSAYGSLWFSSDTQSQAALTYRNRMSQVLTGIQNRTLFFDLWWKSLDDSRADGLLPDADHYPDYAYSLRSDRRFKPFTLDEKSEQIINSKDANGMSTLITLYTMLTNRLEFSLEVKGESLTLNRDGLMSYVRSPDGDLRATAYQELHRVYAKEADILAQIYISRVRDWHSEQVELRQYASPLSVRNLNNNIPDAAVTSLLQVARANAPIFQRYFTLKAQWLGLKTLRRSDIYAPLSSSDVETAYPAAVDMVLGAFAEFDGHMAEEAERVFAENHIDSEVRKGKRAGAFCATVLPSQTPWVLMNYTGKIRDVATLAHELGHAIHSMMAQDHSVLTQHAPLPLAETASVFCEMLLTEKLLAQEADPLARRDLLAGAIDDMYATVMRQAYFVIFEQSAHAAILDNRSPDDLHALYLEQLREQFGESVEIDEAFAQEWVSIPHIYNVPFYCYAYSFGQLLVLALYRRYQQEGDGFKPGYLKLLAYGGSADPAAILNEIGIDIADPAFWQGGFDVISQMIDELDAIRT